MKRFTRGIELFGQRVSFIVSPQDSSGAPHTIFHIRYSPGSGDALHANDVDDELWHVVEGELAIVVGDETVVARQGETIGPIPAGTAHTVKNTGEGPAAALVVVTPGKTVVPWLTELTAFLEAREDPMAALADPAALAAFDEINARHKVRRLW